MHIKCHDDGCVPFLRFSPEAQVLFDAWRGELEKRLRGDELKNTPAFEAHLSKYRSLMPSLALLFHLIHGGSHDVCLDCARLAAGWCEYLEHHAKKIYAEELAPGLGGAHALAVKIRQGAVKDGDSLRDTYRHRWAGLTNAESVSAALDVLHDAGWIRIETVLTGGRDSEIIRLNPKLGGEKQ